MRYLKIIGLYFQNSLQVIITQPLAFWMFFTSKLIRYGLFFVFLYFVTRSVGTLGGYTPVQMLTFYLVFNLIDTASQMLYREVYRFRPLVISGQFDWVLVKPFPPLIRVLVGGPDFIDLGILITLLIIFLKAIMSLQPSPISILTFIILFLCALAISTAFHIFVLGLGIITLSVDHLVMVYRDFTSLMRIPVDFFNGSIRFLFTYIIPLGIMFTFPAKALMNLLSITNLLVSISISLLALITSLLFWRYSLKQYQSASS